MTDGGLKNGKLTVAKERMEKEDGSLAKHSTNCNKRIDWENPRVLGIENRMRQRKLREEIESLEICITKRKYGTVSSL